MLKNVTYSFGLYIEPLEVQAKKQGYKLRNSKFFQKVNNSIFWLKFSRLITNEEFNSILHKFNNLLIANTEEIKN